MADTFLRLFQLIPGETEEQDQIKEVLVNTRAIATIDKPNYGDVVIKFSGMEDDYIVVKDKYEDIRDALIRRSPQAILDV